MLNFQNKWSKETLYGVWQLRMLSHTLQHVYDKRKPVLVYDKDVASDPTICVWQNVVKQGNF